MSPTSYHVVLADHGLIRATGEEAAVFLHNLLTNDITHLPPGGVRLAGFCAPNGRMLASFTIWRERDDYLLLLSADILPAVLKKLSMYILRSKVKLTDITHERQVVGVSGPQAEALIGTLDIMSSLPFAGGSAIRLDAGRFVLALPVDNSAPVVDRLAASARSGTLEEWRLGEIEHGVPRLTTGTQEAFTPQMINYELPAVGGVSFQKGCYPGQEVVARTQYLGKVKRRMVRVRLPAAFPPGTDVFSSSVGAQHCGAVVLTASLPDGAFETLLVAPLGSVEANDIRVGAPDGPQAQLLPLPYAVE